MSSIFENKFAQVAVLSLFGFAFALNAGALRPAATPARTGTVLIAGQRIGNGPTMPPDPWAGERTGNGPTMPPDPWAGVA
jgi:hypothetical protein